MRWRVSLLAGESLLVGATGWGCCHPPAFVPGWSHPRRGDVHPRGSSRGQHHQEQKKLQQVEFKGVRRRRRLPPTSMTAPPAGGGGCGGGDRPSSWYNKEAWQRRASRAMKYVSMPIVKKAGQPREQVRRDRFQLGAFLCPKRAGRTQVERAERGWSVRKPSPMSCEVGGELALPPCLGQGVSLRGRPFLAGFRSGSVGVAGKTGSFRVFSLNNNNHGIRRADVQAKAWGV